MKVFISGIAGFLGSHLADKFIKEGHHVVGCDNLINLSLAGHEDNFQYVLSHILSCTTRSGAEHKIKKSNP